MSKPKPRAAEPPTLGRVPSTPIPATARKSSQPAINTQGTARFYDGPTVTSRSDEVKAQAKAVASKTAAVTKASSKRAVATAKRHPWSVLSLITTLPFFILISIASTITCPPPGVPSNLNRYVLSPLGYAPHQSHPVLCYPANVYHREFLQPYVYPVLGDVQDRLTRSPAYRHVIGPATTNIKTAGSKAWNGPVKPVVNNVTRAARKFYLTFIQPHIPYLKARFHTFVDPYTTRISAFSSPHLTTVRKYAYGLSNKAIEYYEYASTHPLTGHANDYAKKGYKVSSEKGYQAFQWSRPHAHRFRRETERIATQVLGPRAVQAAEMTAARISQAWGVLKAQVYELYNSHLDPHVGSYVKKASVAAAPYTALYAKHIYVPYVKPAVEYFFPTPITPKSFLSIFADFLPTSATHAAEKRGSMDDYYADLSESRKPADVHVPGTKKLAKKQAEPPLPPLKESKQEKKERVQEEKKAKLTEREEIDRVRDAVRARVEEQGKKGQENVKKEIKAIKDRFLNEDVNILATNMRTEIEREIEYVVKGLDKLYTTSTSLTQDQVKMSSEQSDARVKKVVDKVKERLDTKKSKVVDEAKAVVSKQSDALDKALGVEYRDLASKLSSSMDITSKDWDKYNEIRKCFRARVGILKRTALDRIDARQAMSAEPSRVSILPVVGAGAGAALGGAAGIIGKGKEQVIDALNQAAGKAAPSTTGVMDQAKASAQSIIDAASSGIHDATRSAISAGGGTPSPESPKEHIQLAYNVASESIESVYGAATSSVHDATRSVKKAVGVTPTPESPREHAESAYSAAVDAVESLAAVAEGVIHDATRSVVEAVGGTPSPESPREHAQSLASLAASASAVSVASIASQAAHQATRSVISAAGPTPSPETFAESVESVVAAASGGLEGLASSASEVVHDATRAAIRAVGATPSPETPSEHVESAYHAATNSAASVASAASASASSLASDVSGAVHDATRSAVKALGGTPSPETPNEYLESIANVVAGGAASVYGVVGDNVHDATRSVKSAVGVTPSPESPLEYAESVYGAATSSVSSAAAVVTNQAALLATQLQEALGFVSAPTPLASSASRYISALASQGSSAGSEALASGSSILASLQSEASISIHSATRAASRAAGATPTPETPGEYVDDLKDRVLGAKKVAESLVKKHAGDLAKESASANTKAKKEDL
ncbi:hypothetical protein IAR55_003251 [Kwoniella newhampshirensis]|uniref:Uncharacterized protein n=1 Tax=Kwoniella newhampshirensis TaxID=1651941 RepID=A0AAW0YYC1_9TREE